MLKNIEISYSLLNTSVSGSLIIRDGKIIGAVIQVLVNDPTRRYGRKLMKLLNYDFYDLQALIVFFRAKPDCVSEYAGAIEQIISTLENGSSGNDAETNTIRKILQGYVSREESGLSWIWTENVYTGNVVIIKEERYYHILAQLFREMLQCISDSSRLYELCDAMHNLPTVMVENKKPEKLIKSVMQQIERKG